MEIKFKAWTGTGNIPLYYLATLGIGKLMPYVKIHWDDTHTPIITTNQKNYDTFLNILSCKIGEFRDKLAELVNAEQLGIDSYVAKECSTARISVEQWYKIAKHDPKMANAIGHGQWANMTNRERSKLSPNYNPDKKDPSPAQGINWSTDLDMTNGGSHQYMISAFLQETSRDINGISKHLENTFNKRLTADSKGFILKLGTDQWNGKVYSLKNDDSKMKVDVGASILATVGILYYPTMIVGFKQRTPVVSAGFFEDNDKNRNFHFPINKDPLNHNEHIMLVMSGPNTWKTENGAIHIMAKKYTTEKGAKGLVDGIEV